MKRINYLPFISFLGAFALIGVAHAEDITNLGGDLTSSFTDRNAIQLTAPNVTDEEHRLSQLNGFAVFHGPVTKKEGLGPRFNHVSCGSCHVNNGRGRVKLPGLGDGSQMVIKVSLPGLLTDGTPQDVPKLGEQILDHNVAGENLFNVSLSWKYKTETYPDGSQYQLRSPKLRFVIPGYRQRQIAHSLRMTPAVIGPGLLEAIPEETILALSDPEDSNGDGISGRPQYVPDRRTGTLAIGRFGFKGSHTTVEQQSAAAAFHDVGQFNALFTKNSKPSELSDESLRLLTVYQQIAGVPAAQNQEHPEVISGKALFSEIGCADCHIMSITTGSHQFPELVGQVIHPFTDLLLHDMGPGLADKRAEFSASGAEWRTTPLWGLGFSTRLSNVAARFLHDGRARSIEEAILWHGGEGETSRNNFKNLGQIDRQALLAFLNSL